jgi:hypothetical protein
MEDAARAAVEKRKPESAFNQIDDECHCAQPGSEQGPGQQYRKSLRGNRYWADRNNNLGGKSHEQAEGKHQRDGTDPIKRS